ncbi:heparinase II/III family protein [Achromobacter sp. ES-001]|uniref:heparinase II/III family protein n=1 Tax=Achromobacter sp. ES-001 TaxID=2860286 RepID=UPI001C642ADA|nr:heparinase II/III-family protein [Achromobacter sp. ES-001]QYJ23446.1 heparinase II/III family protein [Achromobacter sp. ES-001]
MVTLHGGFEFHIQPHWKGAEALTRTQQRSLHMHCFIGDLLAAEWPKINPEYLAAAMSLIEDWCDRYQYPRDASTMAFHDETTARRLGYWLRLYIALRGENDSAAGKLWGKIDALFSVLCQDDFYAGRNNHGMFQDLAILYFCCCTPDATDMQRKALGRLLDYFSAAVSADGVHKEHSPAYHYLIADNMTRHVSLVKRLDPKSAEDLAALATSMGRYGTSIVTPDGKYPPIGDTQPKAIPNDYFQAFGMEQRLPERSAIFPDGGYAVLRDDPTKLERQTYVVLCASHHGDYHKHQDDLSVLLYADGWIICESGPYGYDYAHPMSKHGYSSSAHSTLEIDELAPSMEPGLVGIVGSSESEDATTVDAMNRRYPGLEHRRSVTLNRAQRQLQIVDTIHADQPRTMNLLWQLAPGIEPIREGRNIQLLRGGSEVARMVVESDIPIAFALGHGNAAPVGYAAPAGHVFPQMGMAEDTSVLRARSPRVASWNCRTIISLT